MLVQHHASACELAEIDEYECLVEIVSRDPDAEPPARYYELCRKYAEQGANIGWRERAPVYMSFGPAWIASAQGATIGSENASS